jgi:molybdopterin molybdotransferase
VLFSGGISVGDYDFVLPVVKRLGVKTLFYKVAQKPGKPLFAGSKGVKRVFALPGNPASALVCWYEYVLPMLDRMQGKPEPGLPQVRLPLAAPFTVKGDRDQFLRARVEAGRVHVLTAQDSDNLRSFAASNALVLAPAGLSRLSAGEPVEVHLLPFAGPGSVR